MTHVSFGKCLETGITSAAVVASVGLVVGSSFSGVVMRMGAQLVGITAGNYFVHKSDVCKEMEETTKVIIVVAAAFFASVTFQMAVFSLCEVAIDVKLLDTVFRGEAFIALVSFLFSFGYLDASKPAVA